MSTLASGAGVQVPDGDPGALQGAADYHYQLADGLEYHAGTMDHTASAVYHVWSGEAAGSYQTLSAQVAAHYRSAAGTARDVGDALTRYAGELHQYQQEGLRALRQAVYWEDQVRQWEGRLKKAQADVRTAERAVHTAQSQLHAASALGPGADSAAGAAHAHVAAAQRQLTRAQGEVRTCQEELRNAEHQLSGWQRRGGQIWEEAQHAADRATGTLDATCVVTPPLAAPPAPAPQPHHSGGGLLGQIAKVAAVVLPIATDALGGGPEDPLADTAALAEREALASASDDAATSATSDAAAPDAQQALSEADHAENPTDYSRPSGFRDGVRDKVWESNRQESTGQVRDPQTGHFMSQEKPWDMGHKPGYEFRKHQQSAETRGISRKQFLDEHNNPEHYRPENPRSNRNHQSENPTNEYFGP